MRHTHHSPATRAFGKFTWFVTSVVSILVGLLPFGFNILTLPVIRDNVGPYINFVLYGIGALGLLSLISLFTCWNDETEHRTTVEHKSR